MLSFLRSAHHEGYPLIWAIGLYFAAATFCVIFRVVGGTDDEWYPTLRACGPMISLMGWYYGLAMVFMLGGSIVLGLHIAGVF